MKTAISDAAPTEVIVVPDNLESAAELESAAGVPAEGPLTVHLTGFARPAGLVSTVMAIHRTAFVRPVRVALPRSSSMDAYLVACAFFDVLPPPSRPPVRAGRASNAPQPLIALNEDPGDLSARIETLHSALSIRSTSMACRAADTLRAAASLFSTFSLGAPTLMAERYVDANGWNRVEIALGVSGDLDAEQWSQCEDGSRAVADARGPISSLMRVAFSKGAGSLEVRSRGRIIRFTTRLGQTSARSAGAEGLQVALILNAEPGSGGMATPSSGSAPARRRA